MPQKSITKKTDTNSTPYNDVFFRKRQAWRADYEAIARWISKNVEGNSFADLGCGNGAILASLLKDGKKVWGVDSIGNLEQIVDKKVLKYVKKADLTQPQKFASSDIVLCFDVADRIDKQYADTLVKNIVSTNANIVMFTASQPGQAGIHHVNLQPREYWLDKFAGHGYYLDAALNETFKADLAKDIKNLIWYRHDILILRKHDANSIIKAYTSAGTVIEELTAEVELFKNKNKKLRDDLWVTTERLNSILSSARWKASSKLIRLIKR